MVNINDYSSEASKGEELGEIFRHQASLMEKYHDIEAKNGFYVPHQVPVNLHDAKDQARLKDMAWRVTEEVGEALEAFRIHPKHPEHFKEEMADALHFLTEFTILAGTMPRITLNQLYLLGRVDVNYLNTHTVLCEHAGRVVECLAVTCNTLKNKPWKQTQMMTDETYFANCLLDTWVAFIGMCIAGCIDREELYDLYFRKNKVNQFRQESNY